MNESYYRDALQRYRSEDTESLYLIIENEDSLTEEAVKAAVDALVERGHGIADGESNESDQSEGFSAEALKAAEDLFLDKGLEVDESESNECGQLEGSQLAANLPADKKPNIHKGWGIALMIAGGILMFFFLFIFSTAVDNTNNIGLLVTKLSGIVVSVGIAVIGSIFYIGGMIKDEMK